MLISNTTCHQGLVREQNEDSYISQAESSLWLVADGVGGNIGGDMASQLAVQTIERQVRQGDHLKKAISSAHQAILSAVTRQPELNGMATTVVAAKFDAQKFELAWVGDSRAYLISENAIQQLSTDHNVANELFMQGSIAEAELAKHLGQHELTQALGEMSLVDIPCKTGRLKHGDILLLCSDGLSGVLSDQTILDTCKQFDSLVHISESLLSQVLAAGAPDNVTFTLLAWDASQDVSSSRVTYDTRLKQVSRIALTWKILCLVVVIMAVLLYAG